MLRMGFPHLHMTLQSEFLMFGVLRAVPRTVVILTSRFCFRPVYDSNVSVTGKAKHYLPCDSASKVARRRWEGGVSVCPYEEPFVLKFMYNGKVWKSSCKSSCF